MSSYYLPSYFNHRDLCLTFYLYEIFFHRRGASNLGRAFASRAARVLLPAAFVRPGRTFPFLALEQICCDYCRRARCCLLAPSAELPSLDNG